jgi:hypothetical protein
MSVPASIVSVAPNEDVILQDVDVVGAPGGVGLDVVRDVDLCAAGGVDAVSGVGVVDAVVVVVAARGGDRQTQRQTEN